MNCTLVRKKSAAYISGALSPEERRHIEGHLAGCPLCARETDKLRGVWGMLGELPADRQAPDLTAEVLSRIARHEEERFGAHIRAWFDSFRPAFAAATAAAVFIGFVCGFSAVKFFIPGGTAGQAADEDTYAGVFSEAPPSSVSDAYISLLSESGDNNS